MNEIIFQYFNNFAGRAEWLDVLAIFSAEYLGWWLLAGAGVLIWKGKDRLKNYFFVFFSIGLAWLVAQIIKFFYFSPRPFLALSDFNQLIQHGANDSFPSGHAAVFFALAAAIFLLCNTKCCTKFYAAVFFLGAFVIGISRIIVGIHWPLDILAGAIVGILSVFIIKMLATRWLTSQTSGLFDLQKELK